MSTERVQQAAALFDRRAKQYDEKYRDVSLYHAALDVFCQSVKQQSAAILELACGPGNISRYLLQQRPDFRLLGIDLAPAMVALAAQYHPAAEFKVMDCRDIAQLPGNYDGVMCSFCLPYLDKEETSKLIADASALMRPGGIFYISTMEDDYDKSGIQRSSYGDEVYMYFHESAYLEQALASNGMELLQVYHQDFRPESGEVMTDLVILARKQ